MKLLNAISYINIKDSNLVYRYLETTGYKIYKTKNNEIKSIEDFFVWVKKELQQDHEFSGEVNFDDLIDSLWEVLMVKQKKK